MPFLQFAPEAGSRVEVNDSSSATRGAGAAAAWGRKGGGWKPLGKLWALSLLPSPEPAEGSKRQPP